MHIHSHKFKLHYVLRSVQSLDFLPAYIHSVFLWVHPEDFVIIKEEMFYWQNGMLHFNLVIVTKFVTLKMICYLGVLL